MNVISARKQVNMGRKLDQVRDGARRIFLRDGFVAANVNDITKAAGVSKATLYSYFPDKELMFHDSMKSVFDGEGPKFVADDPTLTAVYALPEIAIIISEWLCRTEQKQIYRLALTEAERFPKFAIAYWADREAKVKKPLHNCLRNWNERRELAIDDIDMAARHLIAICETYIYIPVKPGREREQDQLRRDAVENGADLFLRAYQTGSRQIAERQYASGYF